MKTVLQFIKSTLLGGLLFLVPVVIVVLVLGKALSIVANLLLPIAHVLPQATFLGAEAPRLAAGVLLVLVCFLVGLLARTPRGRAMASRMERMALGKIPGYSIFRGTAPGLVGADASNCKVALASIEEAWVLAFVLEKLENGLHVVFVPASPTPAAGSVYYLEDDRVKILDVPVLDAIKCVMRLGVGSRDLIGTRV